MTLKWEVGGVGGRRLEHRTMLGRGAQRGAFGSVSLFGISFWWTNKKPKKKKKFLSTFFFSLALLVLGVHKPHLTPCWYHLETDILFPQAPTSNPGPTSSLWCPYLWTGTKLERKPPAWFTCIPDPANAVYEPGGTMTGILPSRAFSEEGRRLKPEEELA